MKIAICTPELGALPGQPTGGVAAATEWLIRGLLSLNTPVEIHVVVVPAPADECTPTWGELPVSVHRVRRSRLRNQLGILGGSDVDTVLERIAPDVVHVQGHASALDGRKHGAVLTIHGIPEIDTLLRGGMFAAIKSWFVGIREGGPRHRYPHLVAIANSVLLGINQESFKGIHAIPNAINEIFFSEQEVQVRDNPVVLQVGRIIRGKNLMGLVDALATLRSEVPGLSLRIVGAEQDRDYVEQIRSRVREVDMEDMVTWLGALSHDALLGELATARVLALPSLQETAPICIAEAHAMGVPVVASDVGGVSEMVEHGVNGMLVNPSELESLVTGLRGYLKDASLAYSHGIEGQKFAKRYHPRQVAAETLQVYRGVLG